VRKRAESLKNAFREGKNDFLELAAHFFCNFYKKNKNIVNIFEKNIFFVQIFEIVFIFVIRDAKNEIS